MDGQATTKLEVGPIKLSCNGPYTKQTHRGAYIEPQGPPGAAEIRAALSCRKCGTS